MKRGFGSSPGAAVARICTANTSVTNSTTLVVATGMSVPVSAGCSYVLQATLRMDCNNSGLLKVAVHGTAAGSGSFNYCFYDTGTGLLDSAFGGVTFKTSQTPGNTSLSTSWLVDVTGAITVTTSGTLEMHFAQNASNGTATRVFIRSTMIVTKV